MTLYHAYYAGWQACLNGVDGRYWFNRPDKVEQDSRLRAAWQIGWNEAFNRDNGEDENPTDESILNLDNDCTDS